MRNERKRQGSVDLQDGGNFVIKGKKPFNRGSHGIDAWQLEHFPFFDAIRNNKPYNELESAAHSTMTAIMGRMATYSGNIVKWDEALGSEHSLAPAKYDPWIEGGVYWEEVPE